MATSGSLGERGAGLGVAGQHVQQPVGQAGGLEQPGDECAAGDGGLHVRLEHDGVAQRQRRRDGPDRRGSAGSSTG